MAKYTWSFNDPTFNVGLTLRNMWIAVGGPLITGDHPGDGDGVGEYHAYFHDAGAANSGAIGKSCAFQAYKSAGSGGTLTAIWADVTANGTWSPQTAGRRSHQ